MRRSFEPIAVATSKTSVEISQDYGNGEEPNIIYVAPEQIPVLIQWLGEAQNEFAPTEAGGNR